MANVYGNCPGLGKVQSIIRQGNERRFVIVPSFVMANVENGESIAVNGVCLSVEKYANGAFTAYASAETLNRTNLQSLKQDAQVNLERALALGERMGGHIVSGHIDCIARVASIGRSGESLSVRVSFPAVFGPQVVAKGSVSLNGISLTVNECGNDYLVVNVIPDSQRKTNLPQWRPGSEINMETDIVGKYVQRLLAPWQGGALERQNFWLPMALCKKL